MTKRAPTLLSGDCPYAIYRETRIPGEAVPHYQVAEIECDFSDECGLEKCPLGENAPKHPPGIGLG